MKKKRIVFGVIVLIAVGLIALLPSMHGDSAMPETEMSGNITGVQPASKLPSHTFTVRTEEAEIRTLQAYLEVNANIVSANQVAVMPDANGRLVSMLVSLGDYVQRGSIIAEVDPSRPGTEYSLSPVYAPVSGMVVTSPQAAGSTVSTSTVLMTIAVNNSIEVEALIPEREVGQLRAGLRAQIRLEAFPGEIFSAAVTQVSPVMDPVSRTKKIVMRFERNDPRISPGMFARVKLNTRTYENVVSVPSDALAEYRGRTVVYVLNTGHDGNYLNGNPVDTPRVEMREVITGVNVDREVEITNGLKPGESVVVQGQQFLTDGAAVRVIGRRI